MGKDLVPKITNLNIQNASAIDYSIAAGDTVKWGLSSSRIAGIICGIVGGLIVAALVIFLIRKKLQNEGPLPLGYRLFIREFENEYHEDAKTCQLMKKMDEQLANLLYAALSGGDITSVYVGDIILITVEKFVLEPKNKNENRKEIEMAFMAFIQLLKVRNTREIFEDIDPITKNMQDDKYVEPETKKLKRFKDCENATKEFRTALGLKKPIKRASVLK